MCERGRTFKKKQLTIGVEWSRLGCTSPDNWDHSHGQRDGTDTIVYEYRVSAIMLEWFALYLTDITERRTHGGGGYTEDSLNGLTGPSQLTDDLLIGQTGQRLIFASQKKLGRIDG